MTKSYQWGWQKLTDGLNQKKKDNDYVESFTNTYMQFKMCFLYAKKLSQIF